MSTKSTKLMLAAFAALALAACEKSPDATKPADKPATSATAAATGAPVTTTPTPTTATPPAAAVALADTDLATPAEFEDEAEKAITAKNYKAELASLETEVSKD